MCGSNKNIFSRVCVIQRLIFISISLCLTILLYGCKQVRDLSLPEITELCREIQLTFSDVNGISFYTYSGSNDINISIDTVKISREDTYHLVMMIRDLAMSEEFQNHLFEYLNINPYGLTPTIVIRIYDETWSEKKSHGPFVDSRIKYSFESGYYIEPYDSRKNITDYTYNGYSDWSGTQYYDTYWKSISMDDIVTGAGGHP